MVHVYRVKSHSPQRSSADWLEDLHFYPVPRGNTHRLTCVHTIDKHAIMEMSHDMTE